MEEGNDQPRGGERIYTLRDEEAFLQTDDEKPAIIAEPPLTLPSSNAGSAGSPTSKCRRSSAPSIRSGTPTTSPTRR
jgi:hypothetical protein